MPSSFSANMPRNPEKEPFSGQLSKDEDALLVKQADKKDWSKAKLIQKIIRWWLGEKGLMSKVDMP